MKYKLIIIVLLTLISFITTSCVSDDARQSTVRVDPTSTAVITPPVATQQPQFETTTEAEQSFVPLIAVEFVVCGVDVSTHTRNPDCISGREVFSLIDLAGSASFDLGFGLPTPCDGVADPDLYNPQTDVCSLQEIKIEQIGGTTVEMDITLSWLWGVLDDENVLHQGVYTTNVSLCPNETQDFILSTCQAGRYTVEIVTWSGSTPGEDS